VPLPVEDEARSAAGERELDPEHVVVAPDADGVPERILRREPRPRREVLAPAGDRAEAVAGSGDRWRATVSATGVRLPTAGDWIRRLPLGYGAKALGDRLSESRPVRLRQRLRRQPRKRRAMAQVTSEQAHVAKRSQASVSDRALRTIWLTMRRTAPKIVAG